MLSSDYDLKLWAIPTIILRFDRLYFKLTSVKDKLSSLCYFTDIACTFLHTYNSQFLRKILLKKPQNLVSKNRATDMREKLV